MRTAECDTAIERLSTYIANPKSASAELDTALDHIRDCPDCRRRIGYLVRAAKMNDADRMDCQACQARLPEYVEALGQGVNNSATSRAVALHLAVCPYCLAVYADLADMARLATGRIGAEPPVYPQPDLSFLPGPVTRPARRLWRLDTLGRIVIEFSADLLASLLPQPELTPIGLKSDASPAEARSFSLAGEIADTNISVTIEPPGSDPARCTVVARVEIPSRGGWPNLGDTLVVLQRADTEIARQFTDAFGSAVFERVAVADLEQLVFVIERSNQS